MNEMNPILHTIIYPNYKQNTSYWISIAENLKDLDATQTRLLQNPKDIADVFRRYYGIVVANKIQQLLTEHLEIEKDLIVALKN